MSAMAGVVGLMIILYAVCIIFSSSSTMTSKTNHPPVQSNYYHQWLLYITYYRTACEESRLTSTISFGFLLSNIIISVCLLTSLSIVLSVPLYVLKDMSVHSSDNDGDETQYTTHSHMYRWLWTMAFLSGSIPAIILLVVTLVCLMFFSFILNQIILKTKFQSTSESQLPSLTDDTIPTSLPDSNLLQKRSEKSLVGPVWIVFIFNTLVVGAVNGLYLWSTLVDLSANVRLWIQVGFAFFSFLWNVAILQGTIPLKIKDSRYGVLLFSCLSLMNHVIIPCIVTALSSPSCYQV